MLDYSWWCHIVVVHRELDWWVEFFRRGCSAGGALGCPVSVLSVVLNVDCSTCSFHISLH